MTQEGAFSDPGMPADGVMIEPFQAGGPTTRVWYDPRTWRTEGWILEKRSYNEFYRSEVPARARRIVEKAPTGNTREMEEGGKCWTECEYVTRTYLQRYYVVSRRIEWWRVNVAMRDYYDFVTGPVTGLTGMGVGVATASAGGRTVMQGMARETVKAMVGRSIPALVPTLQTAANTISVSSGLGAVGLGITIFVGVSYLSRGWFADAVLVSRGSELDPERSGYGPMEEPTDSEPYWQICGQVRNCGEEGEDGEVGSVPGTTPVPAGGLTLPAGGCLWGIIAAGLLAIAALGIFLLTRGDDGGTLIAVAGATPGATATPTEAPTAAPSPTPTPGIVTGDYSGEVTVAEDPAGHRCCVEPSTAWEVRQVRNTQTNEVAITLFNVVENVSLQGRVPVIGQEFTATGSGTVAGYSNVEVSFTGTASAETGINGVLTVGGNGALPQGQPIVFDVAMQKVQ